MRCLSLNVQTESTSSHENRSIECLVQEELGKYTSHNRKTCMASLCVTVVTRCLSVETNRKPLNTGVSNENGNKAVSVNK